VPDRYAGKAGEAVGQQAREAIPGLTKHGDVRSEVDVIGGTFEDEGGHGFHPGALGFGNAGFLLAEVNVFDIEPRGVEGVGDVLFGGHADGTTGVIEDGFAFHDVVFGLG
jgi:hypothetical protein